MGCEDGYDDRVMVVSGLFERQFSLDPLLEIGVPALFAVGILGWRWWRRKQYRANLFDLRFADGRLRAVADLVTQTVDVDIVVSDSIEIGHFDMRFVGEVGRNVDPETIMVASVRDKLRNRVFILPDRMGQEGNYPCWANLNPSGEIDCYLNPPLPMDAQRTLQLAVTYEATQAWDGWLTFRGRDKGGKVVPPTGKRFTVLI